MARFIAMNESGESLNSKPRSLAWVSKRQAAHGDVYSIRRYNPPKRRWKVLVLKRNGKGRREASLMGRKRFTKAEAIAFAKKKGPGALVQRELTERQIGDALINKWLSGDTDCERDLLLALARTARDIKHRLHVNFGRRSRAEQQALWDKYGSPRAARPGTSRHETGLAADVVSRLASWRNAGDIRGFRVAARRHGLCLPVGGETWHVERGNTWRA